MCSWVSPFPLRERVPPPCVTLQTIIFAETKRKVDELTRRMRRDGWPAMCIHGDKSQPERDWVLGGESALTTTATLLICLSDVPKRTAHPWIALKGCEAQEFLGWYPQVIKFGDTITFASFCMSRHRTYQLYADVCGRFGDGRQHLWRCAKFAIFPECREHRRPYA